MTQSQLDELSEPFVRLFLDMEDRLLRKIAEQLAYDGDLSVTSKWRMRQLARAGLLDKESLKIIREYTGIQSDMIDIILQTAALNEIGYVDSAVRAAVEKGIIDGVTAPPADVTAMNAMKSFYRQALIDTNAVNTVMRYRAKQAYVNAVNTAYFSAKEAQRIHNALGSGTAAVVTGAESLQTAVRDTIKQLSREGIPAFVDKAGREWSPEAYVRMDIRTTAANTARQAQFDRCRQYNIKLIQVDSHRGARPLCALFQGHIFSLDGTSGSCTDGSGRKIDYTPLSSTSYGEPAGLFGINCGHNPYPFIPGINTQHYFPTENMEENSKEYRQFQQQRAMERDIRRSKRECMLLDASGNSDSDDFRKAAEKLKHKQKRYKDYCTDTGLKYHGDRTQVYGYDRSVSVKASAAGRKAPSSLTNVGNGSTINTSKSISGTICGAPMSIDDALKANPNYSSGREYQINCQRCVQAYEFRRRGYDVIAMPKPSSNNLVSWGNECFIPSSANPRDEYIFSNAASEVKKELTAAPDGARYSVYIAWKGRLGGAHVFIAEKQGNTIRYVDPQNGKSDVSSYFLQGKRFGLFRLDDKDIQAADDIINQTVEKATK